MSSKVFTLSLWDFAKLRPKAFRLCFTLCDFRLLDPKFFDPKFFPIQRKEDDARIFSKFPFYQATMAADDFAGIVALLADA